ncbi:MAG: RNA 2',3'-cyclic phosphodiesterase [Synergistaceae bacterium]|jgi:2'-5' RNA ligase|nr:RNA 2',3'-cyclic phosphodiesterase [Synergistaceae bacterium]
MTDPEILRAFVAVIPPEDVLDRLERFVARLRLLALFKWTTRKQWHITLRFLGEAPKAKVEVFANALEKMEMGMREPFNVRLSRAGGFPKSAQSRALWLGGDGGNEDLTALAGRVERIAVASGFPPEMKKYTPHLTLARLREAAPLPLGLAEALAEAPTLTWRCEGFFLVKSELTPEGAVYTPLRLYRRANA